MAASAEERERLEVELAENAQLALAVGPLLQREFARLLHPRGVAVHEFLPGLNGGGTLATPPPGAQCLVLGRAEDIELKGLDVAAQAVARAGTNRPELRPLLMIRGAPPGTGDLLRADLQRHPGNRGLDVRVRNFTTDTLRISDDLRQSTVVLMPSRSEGFGLVGLEAIDAGVPVLMSSRSGLGELLGRVVPDLAALVVVPITGNLKKDSPVWARHIERILQNPIDAFDRAARLRAALAVHLDWERSLCLLLGLLHSSPSSAHYERP